MELAVLQCVGFELISNSSIKWFDFYFSLIVPDESLEEKDR
jgi:hypothetical protein